jgi:hypothetical protein
LKQEVQTQGLNLKCKAGGLSRQGTSSIEAHSSEEGTLVGTSATSELMSVLGCPEEWVVALSNVMLLEVDDDGFIDLSPNLGEREMTRSLLLC